MRYIALLILLTILYTVFSYFFGKDIKVSIFFIGLLWLLPLSIRIGKDILEKKAKVLKNKFERKKKRQKNMSIMLQGIKKEGKYLEDKLTNLSKLYAITKEMSFSIRFTGLFNSLKNFLEDNFQFDKFTVALFKLENGISTVDRVYEINKASVDAVKPDPTLKKVCDVVIKSRKDLFINDTKSLRDFGLTPETKNISVIPLIAQKEIISAALIKNTNKVDHGKFLILVQQLALEIKRISLFDDVERLSITDGLTGAFLRRHFLERLKGEMLRTTKSRMEMAFIMADLDFFKKCNDSFGHLVGDVVLEEVADILKKNVREIDLVARYGGEEFCILLPETNKTGAYAVGERIRKAVEEQRIKAYDESIKMTISMGISVFPGDSSNIEELIEKADEALYKAKEEGRNKVCLTS